MSKEPVRLKEYGKTIPFPAPKCDHDWDWDTGEGERCKKCGDKDWMR